MITTKNFNNISEEAKANIKPLRPGEVAEYEFVNVKPDPENKGLFKMPYMQGVPEKSNIYDKDGYKKIAFIKDVVHDVVDGKTVEKPVFGQIYFYQAQAGRITLYGDNREDVLLHEYLQLCPHRKGSPYENRQDQTIFRFLDHAEEAKEKAASRNLIIDATTRARTMSDEEINRYAFLFATKAPESLDVARMDVEQYAFNNPQKFMDLVQDETRFGFQFAFAKGLKDGLIKVLPGNEVRYVENDVLIAKLPANIAREDLPKEFANWTMEHGENKDLATKLQETVEPPKKKPIKKPADKK